MNHVYELTRATKQITLAELGTMETFKIPHHCSLKSF